MTLFKYVLMSVNSVHIRSQLGQDDLIIVYLNRISTDKHVDICFLH